MIERLTQQLMKPRAERIRQLANHVHARPVGERLKLLSFNMQAGMGMGKSHHYVTRSWQHVLPHPRGREHLERIAGLLRDYDVIALQEVDGGSLRSGYVNQLRHLAERGDFAFWYQQLNRDFGPLGQYSNGLLSRHLPNHVEAFTLPGMKGRGAILGRYGSGPHPLLVLNLHLALGQKARASQLAFVSELIAGEPHVVVMGDLNCNMTELAMSALGQRDWRWLDDTLPTYPSWKPSRQIDHILVSPSLEVASVAVLDTQLSDHRPLALELILPPGLHTLPEAS